MATHSLSATLRKPMVIARFLSMLSSMSLVLIISSIVSTILSSTDFGIASMNISATRLIGDGSVLSITLFRYLCLSTAHLLYIYCATLAQRYGSHNVNLFGQRRG